LAFFPTGPLNLGFITEGKLAAIFIKPSLGVSQLAGHLLHQLHANKFFGTIHHRAIKINQVFLVPLLGKNKTSARGVLHAHPLLCFKFCFTLFFPASFYQKHKKLVSL
jgi:hypothetical protein